MNSLSLNGIGINQVHSTNNNTERLEETLKNPNTQSDDELKKVCEDFESYLVEQVMKEMKKTTHSEEGEYTEMFSDILYEQYADAITSQSDLGIATMLYESMKRV